MKSEIIKQEIYHAIDVINDKDFLKAIHTLLFEKSKEYEYDLNPKEKKELDRLKKEHKAGKSKSHTVSDVRKMAYQKLRK